MTVCASKKMPKNCFWSKKSCPKAKNRPKISPTPFQKPQKQKKCRKIARTLPFTPQIPGPGRDITRKRQGPGHHANSGRGEGRATGRWLGWGGCRGRAKDNIWIERFWKTIKYEYIYIQPEENGADLFFGIKRFIDDYNYHRRHQGINRTVPSKLYIRQAAWS